MADYKPNDLFVGIVDFFAVLLPGAVLTFALQLAKVSFLEALIANRSKEAKWIIFVIASYLLGHFIFLIGAAFLDDLYDVTYAKHRGVKKRQPLLRYAAHIKRQSLERSRHNVENNFKWVRAFVQLHNQSAAAEIDRLEADSKFFRSLIVVLIGVWLWIGLTRAPVALFFSATLLLLWHWRYTRFRSAKRQQYRTSKLLWNRLQRIVRESFREAHKKGKDKKDKKDPERRRKLRIHLACQIYESLVIAILIGGFLLPWLSWRTTVLCFGLGCFSAWRYADLRWKMTQTAYLYFVLLNPPAEKPESKPEPVPSVSDQVKTLLQDIWGGKN